MLLLKYKNILFIPKSVLQLWWVVYVQMLLCECKGPVDYSTMSPVIATVVVTIMIVVDQSWSSPTMSRNSPRQAASAVEEQSDGSIQRRSIRGIGPTLCWQRRACIELREYCWNLSSKCGCIPSDLEHNSKRSFLETVDGLPKNRNPQSPRNPLKCDVG